MNSGAIENSAPLCVNCVSLPKLISEGDLTCLHSRHIAVEQR